MTNLLHEETNFFSRTILSYLNHSHDLQKFLSQDINIENFKPLIHQRKSFPFRKELVENLHNQYTNSDITGFSSSPSNQNIQLLSKDNTFTVTTGHQLNIFTGPLYFIFKIVSTLKLVQQLKDKFDNYNFVPIYWMATEDHDFEEINNVNLFGKNIHWNTQQTGAVGRYTTANFEAILLQLKEILGNGVEANQLVCLMENAYRKGKTLSDATRLLVHTLFEPYGLVIIDADQVNFKKIFAPIMSQDIIEQNSFRLISETNKKLAELTFNVQATPREINFFYLDNQLRERITLEKGRYKVLNTTISFSKASLTTALKNHPERFSPNVLMRPLYQELILPNLAYIGGGAEINYWLQLKSTADFYGISFPMLILRDSALLVSESVLTKWRKLGFSETDLFKNYAHLTSEWMLKQEKKVTDFSDEKNNLTTLFRQITEKIANIDSTLKASAESEYKKCINGLEVLEQKVFKAEKRKFEQELQQIKNLQEKLFPGGKLQERVENFLPFYLKFGHRFIELLYENFNPLMPAFHVLTLND